MSIFAAGKASDFQLGIEATTKRGLYKECVCQLTEVNINSMNMDKIQCIASGAYHTIIISDNKVYATGYDTYYTACIGSTNHQIYKYFQRINIKDESIAWAACGYDYTLYLTTDYRVICAHEKFNGELFYFDIPKKAISVFGGMRYGAIVDEKGSFYIINKGNPKKNLMRYSLGVPVVEVVCCNSFICVLTSDGRVFGNGSLNGNSQGFSDISSLENHTITKITGYSDSCAALTNDGHVYIYGKNDHGQFGNKTTIDDYSGFKNTGLGQAAKDISLSDHLLILTRGNEIHGCGDNYLGQLLDNSCNSKSTVLHYIKSFESSMVFAFQQHTFILNDIEFKNPAKIYFNQIPPREMADRMERLFDDVEESINDC